MCPHPVCSLFYFIFGRTNNNIIGIEACLVFLLFETSSSGEQHSIKELIIAISAVIISSLEKLGLPFHHCFKTISK